ncbi:VOC family protein [Iodidimonas sp. SYSU 1G8]|uniref:VOC family protein n=1 Tax=Iodidimonas sp. SYSU 1G8 TaxID=3133967 RepID=UPI0031FE6254
MAKIGYCTVGSNRLEEAKVFYDALMASIDMKPRFEHPSGGRLYAGAAGMFGVLGPYDGNPATVGNGSMIGFSFDTTDEVAAFHAKALELGGTTDGDPGERAPGAYFAYFRDLDGNKLCAFKFG